MAEKTSKPTMINLQDFVTESLVQIIEGVKDAQKRVEQSGAKINPIDSMVLSGVHQYTPGGYGSEEYGQTIEFDVAVTAGDKGELKGGIGVVSGVFNLGYTAEKGIETSSISRIKFSVPVFLPQQNVEAKPSNSRMGEQPHQRPRVEYGLIPFMAKEAPLRSNLIE